MTYHKGTLETDCGLFDENTKGGAALGFDFGIGLNVPLYMDKLYFNIGIDVNYNGLLQEAKELMNDLCDYLNESMKQDVVSNGMTVGTSYFVVDKNSHYINLPILAGLKYERRISDNISAFAEGGVGLNVRFISDWRIVGKTVFYDQGYTNEAETIDEYSYNTALTFAIKAGLGLKFAKNLSMSVLYYNLGKGSVEGRSSAVFTVNSGKPYTNELKQTLKTITPQLLVVKLGYDF